MPRLFTDDADVIEQAHVAWPWFAGMQPLAGLLFALDGILIGAGDVAFMRNASIVAALGGFVPVTLAAAAFDLGLGGVWAGLATFIVLRLVAGLCASPAGAGRWPARQPVPDASERSIAICLSTRPGPRCAAARMRLA